MRFIFKTDYDQDIRLAKHGGHTFWYGVLGLALLVAPWAVPEYWLAQLTFVLIYATVGLDESDEFLRQNALIRDVWGPTAVPVCETLAGADHFSIVEGLAQPGARLHELALRLVSLR